MVPGELVVTDEMPLTASGKIDRQRLQGRASAQAEEDREQYVAPRTAVEEMLVGIWQQVLRLERVGIEDNFFDRGGHSLLAIQLTTKIQRELGRRFSLPMLYENPTISQQAALIEELSPAPRHPALVRLRPGGSKPPLFCVHPKNGTVFCYSSLAAHLGGDRPFYGVQARGVDMECAIHDSIEEMAAWYLESISQVQPQGPYFLAGYSMGGLIAFEIAQQLVRQGRQVGLLALFDASACLAEEILSLDAFDAIDEVGFLMQEFADHIPITQEELKPLDSDERLLQIMTRAEPLGIFPNMEFNHIKRYVEIARIHMRACLLYKPLPYAGRIVLFKTVGRDDFKTNHGWDDVASFGLDVVQVPGTHLNMLDPPNVQILVERLRRYLSGQ